MHLSWNLIWECFTSLRRDGFKTNSRIFMTLSFHHEIHWLVRCLIWHELFVVVNLDTFNSWQNTLVNKWILRMFIFISISMIKTFLLHAMIYPNRTLMVIINFYFNSISHWLCFFAFISFMMCRHWQKLISIYQLTINNGFDEGFSWNSLDFVK